MLLFSREKKDAIFGALIEIGSGSVVVSIIKSDPAKKHPEIIWSKREFSPLKSSESSKHNPKSIMTTLMNVFLLIDSDGKKVLKSFQDDAEIKYLQMTITAPWSFTISKAIDYKEDENKYFLITTDLIEELTMAAQKKITEDRVKNEIINNRGLSVINKSTTSIVVNGYQTQLPVGQKAMTLSLIQITALAHTFLVDEMADLKNKILPMASLHQYSFAMIFHAMIYDLYPQTTDYCLVDVTYEATEIAIIRNGRLLYSTNAAIGINTLARNFAKVLNIPHEEAYAFMREPYYSTARGALHAVKLAAAESVLADYHTQLVSLLKETGDILSIPRVIFLHGSSLADAIIKDQLTSAAKICTKSSHSIYEITAEILTKEYNAEEKSLFLRGLPDTGVVLAAQFFHKQQHRGTIIHE